MKPAIQDIKSDFERIKTYYNTFYASFMAKGSLPVGATKAGYWGVASSDDLLDLFKRIKLSKYNNFIDLGSGDGKVAMIASLFTHAEGVELDEALFSTSMKIMNGLKINAKLHKMDYFDIDLSVYNVVFINPDQPFYELEKKLRNELTGILVVYDAVYKPMNLRQFDKFFVNGVEIGIYVNG